MLYDLVQKRRGKEIIYMTDTLAKCKSRMAILKDSQRKGAGGDRVEYTIRPSTKTKTYFKKHKHRSH